MNYQELNLNNNGEKVSEDITEIIYEMYRRCEDKEPREMFDYMIKIAIVCIVNAVCNAHLSDGMINKLCREIKEAVLRKKELFDKRVNQ